MAKKQQNSELESLEGARKTLVTEIFKLREKEIALIKEKKTLDKGELKLLNDKKKSLSTIAQKIKEINSDLKDQISNFGDVENSVKSISNLQSGFKKELTESVANGIKLAKSIALSSENNKEAFKSSNELVSGTLNSIAELTNLNKEDTAAIAQKNVEIESSIANLSTMIAQLEASRGEMNRRDRTILNGLIQQRKELQSQYKTAGQFANMQKDVKELYEDMNTELEAGNAIVKKGIAYGKLFFSSWKGAATVIGFALGYIGDEFGKINAQIGGGFTQLVGFKSQLTAISLILGEEAVGAVTEFGARIGNVNKISNGLAFDLGLLPTHLGVSGDEAGKLVNQFGNLQGKSNQVALNTLEATSQLAAANGVIPSQVMKDLATNTELAATYASGFGDNISKAAIDAARLGVDLQTVGKISDGLLDYQTSVAAEMEASVLLGKNLNLQKARELAYADDIDGAMRAALDAAGGIDAFNRMDVFQKKAVAAAIGVSVGELKQMTTNMEEAQKPVGAMTGSFNYLSALVDKVGTTGLGKWMGAFGGLVTHLGTIGFALNSIGIKSIPAAILATKKWIANLFTASTASKSIFAGGSFSAGKEALAKSGRTSSSIKPSSPTKTNNPTAGMSAGKILAIAAAMLAFAGAIYILSQAFAEFDKLKNVGQTLGVFTAAIVGMGLTIGILATILAPLQPVILPLVGAMLAFGGAIALVGFGVNLAASGMATLVKSFSSLETNQLIAATVGIVGLSVAFYGLASSLMAVGAASTLALPGLAALAIGGLVGGVVGGLVGGGENDGLGDKIDALTTAIMAQPIILTLDGNVIAKTVRKETSKSNIPK
jgi:hypothetical protein